MSDHDRGGAGRRKRKQRGGASGRGSDSTSADPTPAHGAGGPSPDETADQGRRPGAQNGGEPAGVEKVTEGAPLSRSERKNQAARDALVPLGEGERPLVVTIGASASTLLFVAAISGWLLWDSLRDDTRPALAAMLLFAAVVGVMAYGMWRVRYWAVLGFQAVLLFSILGSALGIVRATTVLAAVGNLAVLTGAGALFYFMIKALARIQMPERDLR